MARLRRIRLTVDRSYRQQYPLILTLPDGDRVTAFLNMGEADRLLAQVHVDLAATAEHLSELLSREGFEARPPALPPQEVLLDLVLNVPRLAALPWERALITTGSGVTGRHLQVPVRRRALHDLPLRVAIAGPVPRPDTTLAHSGDVMVWDDRDVDVVQPHLVHLAGIVEIVRREPVIQTPGRRETPTWDYRYLPRLARHMPLRLVLVQVTENLASAWLWAYRVAQDGRLPVLVHTSEVPVDALYQALLDGVPLDHLRQHLTLPTPDALVSFLPKGAANVLFPTDFQAAVVARAQESAAILKERAKALQAEWEDVQGDADFLAEMAFVRDALRAVGRIQHALKEPVGLLQLATQAREVFSLAGRLGLYPARAEEPWLYFAELLPREEKRKAPSRASRRGERPLYRGGPRRRAEPAPPMEGPHLIETEAIPSSAVATRRYVNTAFIPQHEAVPLGVQRTLAAGVRYYLRLDIGPASPESNARLPIPLEEERLPPIPEEGLSLDVVVFAGDFTLPDGGEERTVRATMSLPRQGPAVVIRPLARPEGVTEKDLRQYLYVPVQAPRTPMTAAELRVGLYYRNNLVQMLVVGARVTVEEQEVTGWGNWAEPDFTLSAGLHAHTLETLEPRRVNLWFNQSAAGTHRLGIVAGEEGVGLSRTVDFVAAQVGEAVREFRQRLLHTAFDLPPGVEEQELPPEVAYRFSPRDSDGQRVNEGTREQLEHDLIRLAGVGYRLYDLFANFLSWEEQDALATLLRRPTVIQTTLMKSATLVFPWAGVYHHPFLPGDPNNHVCPEFLDAVDRGQDLFTEWTCFTDGCPYEQDINVVCPSGFWGFKHIVEMPLPYPGVDGSEVIVTIPVQGPVRFGLVESLDPTLILRPDHERRLLTWPDLNVLGPFTARVQTLTALRSEAPHVVYFYVHGGRTGRVPWLGIGRSDKMQPTDLRAMHVRWQSPHPLVIINGCHTVNLEPEALLDFVRAFASARAAGVIGTEITLVEPLATWFAERFLTLFLGGMGVGAAMRAVRLELLARYNALGLVYTPYAYATLHLAPEPA